MPHLYRMANRHDRVLAAREGTRLAGQVGANGFTGVQQAHASASRTGLDHPVLLAEVVQEADGTGCAVRHAVGKLAVHPLEVGLKLLRLLFALLLLLLQLANLVI